MLPGKDGISLCREFRRQSSHNSSGLVLTAGEPAPDEASQLRTAASALTAALARLFMENRLLRNTGDRCSCRLTKLHGQVW